MGAGSSTPFSRSPNPAEVKTILNFILREMFRRADLVDLHSLADPKRCSRYLVVAADALDKMLVKMSLFPKKGKDGTFYFQSVEALMKDPPPAIKAEREKNCLDLAFFFIRIFQIFGSMMLTVLDSEMPAADPTTPAKPGAPKQKAVFLAAPELAGFPQKAALRRPSFFGRGGALRSGGSYYLPLADVGDYAILNTYLLNPTVDDAARPMVFESVSALIMPQDRLYDPGPPRRPKDYATQKPVVLYAYTRGSDKKVATAELEITKSGDDTNIKLTASIPGKGSEELTGTLTPRYSGDTRPTTSSNKELPALLQELFEKYLAKQDPASFSVLELLKKRRHLGSSDGTSYKIEGTNAKIINAPSAATQELTVSYTGSIDTEEGKKKQITITTQLSAQPVKGKDPKEYTFRISYEGGKLKVTPADLKGLLDVPTAYRQNTFVEGNTPTAPLTEKEKGKSFSEFVESAFKTLIESVNEEGFLRGGIQYTREGIPKPFDSAEMNEAYRVRKLWEALAKDPPVKSHCIARAVQLLNVAAIQGSGTDGFSSVCRVKFPYVEDGALPKPGDSITSEYGIAALANLFYEKTVGVAMPKLAADAKFQAFGTRLKALFERDPNPFQPNEDLKDVKDKLHPYCNGHTDDVIRWDGRRDAGMLRTLRTKAKELQERQKQHVGTVMRLMFELFNEKQVRAGILEFHPNILRGGVDALNTLAVKVREMLIEYYSDCESTYKDGLTEIRNYRRDLQAKTPVANLTFQKI